MLPSLDEGFGLPALEAMALGIPVVVSTVGALPEVVGDAGLLVDPRDVAGLAAALERVHTDPGARGRSAQSGHRAGGPVQLAGVGAGARSRLCGHTASRPAEGTVPAEACRMRIGVDTRELMGRPTGVGRYLAELLGAWAEPDAGVAGRHEFVLYGPAPLPAPIATRIAPLGPAVRVVPGAGGTAWEQLALPRAVREDASRRLLLAGLHGARPAVLPCRPHHSRPVVLRAPGVVWLAGRGAAASCHASRRRPREGRAHRHGVLSRRKSGRISACRPGASA